MTVPDCGVEIKDKTQNAFSQICEISFESLTNENTLFTIPSYQRQYCWIGAYAEELLQDILNAFDSDEQYYFVGYICLMRHQVESPYEEKDKQIQFDVVDGQQRLTTFKIIFKVLSVLLKGLAIEEDVDDSEILDKLNKWLYVGKRENLPRMTNHGVLKATYKECLDDPLGKEGITVIESYDYTKYESTAKNRLKRHLQEVITTIHNKLKRINNFERMKNITRYIGENCRMVVNIVTNIDNAVRLFRANRGGTVLHSTEYLKAFLYDKVMDDPSAKGLFGVWDTIFEGCGGEPDNMEKFLTLAFQVKMLVMGKEHCIAESVGSSLSDITSPQYIFYFKDVTTGIGKNQQSEKAITRLELLSKVWDLKENFLERTVNVDLNNKNKLNDDDIWKMKQLKWLKYFLNEEPFHLWEVLYLGICYVLLEHGDKDGDFSAQNKRFVKQNLNIPNVMQIEKFVLHYLLKNYGYVKFDLKGRKRVGLQKATMSKVLSKFVVTMVSTMNSCIKSVKDYDPKAQTISISLNDPNIKVDNEITNLIQRNVPDNQRSTIKYMFLRLELHYRRENFRITNMSSVTLSHFFNKNVRSDSTWGDKNLLRKNESKVGNLALMSMSANVKLANKNPKRKLEFFSEPRYGDSFEVTKKFQEVAQDNWNMEKFKQMQAMRIKHLCEIYRITDFEDSIENTENVDEELEDGEIPENDDEGLIPGDDVCNSVLYVSGIASEELKCTNKILIGRLNCGNCHYKRTVRMTGEQKRCQSKERQRAGYLPGFCTTHKRYDQASQGALVPLPATNNTEKETKEKLFDAVQKNDIENFKSCRTKLRDLGDVWKIENEGVSVEDCCKTNDASQICLLLYQEYIEPFQNYQSCFEFISCLISLASSNSLKLIFDSIKGADMVGYLILELIDVGYVENLSNEYACKVVDALYDVFGTESINLGNTLFMLSVKFNNLKVAQRIFDIYKTKLSDIGLELCRKNRDGNTILHEAYKANLPRMIQWIYNIGKDLGIERELASTTNLNFKTAKELQPPPNALSCDSSKRGIVGDEQVSPKRIRKNS